MLYLICCSMKQLICIQSLWPCNVNIARVFSEGRPTFWEQTNQSASCPGHHEWIKYLSCKVFIETIHSEDSSGWVLSFLWAFNWIKCLAPVCEELRALIIRLLSSGSWPLWGHFLLKPPLTPSIHPPHLLSLSPDLSLSLFLAASEGQINSFS